MNVDKKEIGRRIYTIRKSLNYSMEEFGKQIDNAPKGTVNGWEKGKNLPNKKRLELIATMGNTSVDELLHGSFNDYVSELISDAIRIRLSDDILQNFCSLLVKKGISFGDDIKIIRCFNEIFPPMIIHETSTYLIYIPISSEQHLYVAKKHMPVDSDINYYAFADIQNNTLHILPFFLGKNVSDFYTYPNNITEKDGYQYFTTNFDEIGLKLYKSKLIYYGIDIINFEPQITLFKYNDIQKCYDRSGSLETSIIHEKFAKDIDKEILYLKKYTEQKS